MKIALVHDYIKEYGGAERVLKVLSEMYPKAPIYTAFSVKGSSAEREFRGKEIHESWLAPLLKIWKLYSPLRFLTPLVWGTMDLSNYDLVITSCSWYITRGFSTKGGSASGRKVRNTKVIAYCHTPPRWLYGYETSVGFTKYWPVKVYSAIVGHFMRIYDFKTAQPIKYWIANSKNVQERIKKFYRKDSVVIYPPVEVEKIIKATENIYNRHAEFSSASKKILKQVQDDSVLYFLIVSRLVGAKGLEEAIKAFQSKSMSNFKLKIVGEAHGFSNIQSLITNHKSPNVELLGRVSDRELYELYAGAKGFIALARDEDFGITPVEAMAAGTPVIAFNGGGFRESVIDCVTGILINDTDEKTLKEAISRFNSVKWDKEKLQNHAKKFSKERFVRDIHGFVQQIFTDNKIR